MKILILNFNLRGVGTYCRSFHFGRELARYGHKVTMITVSQESRYRVRSYYKRDWLEKYDRPMGEGPWVHIIEGPGLGYKLLPGWGSGPLDIGVRIREILKENYDVVYGFEYHPDISWPVYVTRPFLKYRFISDWCDWFAGSSNHFRGWKLAHRIDGFFEEKIRHVADKVSVISKVLYNRALSIGIAQERIVHIPEGAPTDYIQPLPKEEMRSRLKLPSEIPILATVRNGNMHREVKIFSRVLEQYPEILLLIIGREANSAIELARKLGVADHIISTGWVNDEDYPRYLASADICFCPLEDTIKDTARWPAKILDYLSAGRPVVTNPVGEVGSLFEQREVGLLVEQDEFGFAEDIITLIKDRERCLYLGANARHVMVEEWDWQILGKKIARIVEA